jgi:hypothetical protein
MMRSSLFPALAVLTGLALAVLWGIILVPVMSMVENASLSTFLLFWSPPLVAGQLLMAGGITGTRRIREVDRTGRSLGTAAFAIATLLGLVTSVSPFFISWLL